MKKIIFFMFVILVTGCTGTQTVLEPQSANTQNIESENKLNNIFGTLPEKIISNETFRSCVAQNADMCISEMTYNTEVTVSCDDYILEANKDSCRLAEILTETKESGDISLCDTLNSGKEACRYEIIVRQGRKDYNAEKCNDLDESYKMSCNNQIVAFHAITEKDTNICDNILSETESGEEENIEKEFCIEEVKMSIELEESQEVILTN